MTANSGFTVPVLPNKCRHRYMNNVIIMFVSFQFEKDKKMRHTVDHFIFAWWNFHENGTGHYFAKWWIRDQSLSPIYDSLAKLEVGFTIILCRFRLPQKKVNRLIYSRHIVEFLFPGMQILVYMKMILPISVLLTFPVVDSALLPDKCWEPCQCCYSWSAIVYCLFDEIIRVLLFYVLIRCL